jgi:hypothetical protein
MIAMPMFPLVIELMTKGDMGKLSIAAIFATLHAMMCEGGMCAIAWLPVVFGWIILFIFSPEEEAAPYEPK